MKFRRWTGEDVAEKDLGRIRFTGPNASDHWNWIMTAPDRAASRDVEKIFEEVRAKEFPGRPSRRHCLFLFDQSLEPYRYADSMNMCPFEQYNLVEVELLDSCPMIARVNMSLVGCRIKENRLTASPDEIATDARAYWLGVTHTTFDEEILFSGSYRLTRIIYPKDPLYRQR
jgi:hypothetical protein